jgi:hypothetical protein
MDQRTEPAAVRAGLWLAETFCAREGQPFRRGLSHRASQGMSGRFQIVKPCIILQKGAQIDPQPIPQPQKHFPLLFAQLVPGHPSFLLEPCSFLPGRFQFSQLPLKDTKTLPILLLTFLAILALSAIALMHP